MAFISRHAPTEGQLALAAEKKYDLIHVPDVDAFTGDLNPIVAEYQAFCVVNPALACRLITHAVGGLGVFENANRAPEGAKPTFEAVALHIYRIRMDGCDKQCSAWPDVEETTAKQQNRAPGYPATGTQGPYA
jgi:hypothetical protein